ncbi:MAG TPA: response regulator transcription factor [Sphingomicrobium sp.]|nr:response regulator transcription factor [Sphingomicrobium sp.]
MRILVAEDDTETGEFVRRGLRELGHNPLLTASGVDALHLLLVENFDLAILDRMLPGLDGVSVVRSMRAAKIDIPVLILTALGGIQDRVEGLDSGADDYLVKPFAFSELAARINALARRKPFQMETIRLEYGGIVIDLLKRSVQRDGRAIALQPREFQILEELMREEGRVVTRTMLLERVWEYDFDPLTNIVDTHVSRLRSKLNEGAAKDAIETVRGVGYRMADRA